MTELQAYWFAGGLIIGYAYRLIQNYYYKQSEKDNEK